MSEKGCIHGASGAEGRVVSVVCWQVSVRGFTSGGKSPIKEIPYVGCNVAVI